MSRFTNFSKRDITLYNRTCSHTLRQLLITCPTVATSFAAYATRRNDEQRSSIWIQTVYILVQVLYTLVD
jgi:hypothetical protein